MYVEAKNNSLVALDAVTGRELWVHPFQGPVTSRGMNYWESKDRSDRRIFTTNGGFLTAIDARTGQTVQSFGDNGRTDLRTGLDRDLTNVPPIQTNNPGRIFEDILIMPLMRSGADYSYVPGDIHAYNVRTGKLLWQFHTVPRPGEFGYDTWPKDFWTRSGGGINWNELSIDEKRGIAYIPTGTGKWDHYGADRIGPESVRQFDHRAGRAHRKAAVAFPDGPSRSVGLRSAGRTQAAHGEARRQERGRGDSAHQARIPVRAGSRDGAASVADRGAHCPEIGCAGRAGVAHATLSYQASGFRETSAHRERRQPVHARGGASHLAREDSQRPQRGFVHPTEHEGDGEHPGRQRRSELGNGGRRSRQRFSVYRFA